MFGNQREAKQNQGAHEGQSDLPSAIAPRTIDDPSLDPNRSFIIAIQRNASAKQAAALRLAEKGRQLLLASERERAITYLERALSLHSSPYIHFYLARAHYELGRFQPSLDFLEVAESWLAQQPSWIGEIAELKRKVSTHDTRQRATIGRGMELASRN
jgi:tetratricopeptide (TPR) repeat protein